MVVLYQIFYLGKAQLSLSLTSLTLSIGQGTFRFSPAIPLTTDLSTGSVGASLRK